MTQEVPQTGDVGGFILHILLRCRIQRARKPKGLLRVPPPFLRGLPPYLPLTDGAQPAMDPRIRECLTFCGRERAKAQPAERAHTPEAERATRTVRPQDSGRVHMTAAAEDRSRVAETVVEYPRLIRHA